MCCRFDFSIASENLSSEIDIAGDIEKKIIISFWNDALTWDEIVLVRKRIHPNWEVLWKEGVSYFIHNENECMQIQA